MEENAMRDPIHQRPMQIIFSALPWLWAALIAFLIIGMLSGMDAYFDLWKVGGGLVAVFVALWAVLNSIDLVWQTSHQLREGGMSKREIMRLAPFGILLALLFLYLAWNVTLGFF